MKRFIMGLVIVAGVYSSFAKVSLGIETNFTRNSSTNEQTTVITGSTNSVIISRTYSNFGMNIKPLLGIRPKEVTEIGISLGIGYAKNSSVNKTSTTNGVTTTKHTSQTTQLNFQTGFGVYFYVIRGGKIELGLGPEIGFSFFGEPTTHNDDTVAVLYADYLKLELPFALPLRVDFHPSDHVSIRLGANLFILRYGYQYSEPPITNPTTKYENVDTYVNFDVRSIFSPSLGFVWTF